MAWYKKVVFQKPDLDTALAAYIEGIRPDVPELVAVCGSATAEDRNDPEVLCLECTGSGDLVLANRDHHAGGDDRPACVQAFEAVEKWLDKLRPLVNYVAEVDTGKKSFHRLKSGPSLVWLYSGLMLVHRGKVIEQFWATLRLLHEVVKLGLDPYGSMTKVFATLPEAKEWDAAKREHERWSKQVLAKVQWSESPSGVLIAAVETEWFGAPGLLASLAKDGRKADVTISLNPDFRNDNSGFRKYSVTAPRGDLSKLAEALSNIEPGWGGPVRKDPKNQGAFLGSARETSSKLSLENVVQIAMDCVTSDCIGSITVNPSIYQVA